MAILFEEGSISVSTTEIALVDKAPTQPTFYLLHVDLSPLIAGDTFILRTYLKLTSTGAFVKWDETKFFDAQAVPCVTVPMLPVRYGFKVTGQMVNAVTRTFEWYLSIVD